MMGGSKSSFAPEVIGLLLLAIIFSSQVSASASSVSRNILQISSSEDMLAAAILAANANVTKADLSNPGFSILLTADIHITKPLPTLETGAVLLIQGSCTDSTGNSRLCLIDGANRFQIFTTNYDNPGGLVLENLQIQNAVDGVVNGTTLITARNCTFRDNISNRPEGGAVFAMHHGTSHSPLTLTDCQFINNTAYSGHGGAIWIAFTYGSPQIHIANSIFDSNTAVVGAGGAIKSGGAYFFCYNSSFTNNFANQSGGAIRHKGYNNLTFIHCSFTNNTSGKASGGGLAYSLTNVGLDKSRFCNTSFTDNKVLEPGKLSWNIYFNFAYINLFNYTDPPGHMSFCGIPPPDGTYISPGSIAAFSPITDDCSGCSGCRQECNDAGTCKRDQDYNFECSCPNNYDPLRNCGACVAGSLASKSCIGCESGFIANDNGTCTACPGITDAYGIQFPDIPLKTVNFYSTASSADDCQAQCDAKNGDKNDLTKYCNFWAYWGRNATAHCAGSCLLFYNAYNCPFNPVNYDQFNDLTYQTDDRLGLGCIND